MLNHAILQLSNLRQGVKSRDTQQVRKDFKMAVDKNIVTEDLVVSRFSKKGDLVELEPDNPRTGAVKKFWADLEQVSQACGKLKEGTELTLALSARGKKS